MATAVSVPYNFVAAAPSIADDVDANFDSLVTWINTNAAHLDGSKAFTGTPSGPASDPTTSNQLVRKAYMDAQVLLKKSMVRRAATQSILTATNTDVSWDTEDYDVDGFIAVPGTTMTVPVGADGTYAMAARVTFAIPSTVTISIVDASLTYAQGSGTTANPDTIVHCTTYLAAGVAIRLNINQTSGSARNITARMAMIRLSA